MAAAFWTSTTVMEMTTAGTGLMSRTAPPTSPAVLQSSCAAVACVSMQAGGVTENSTATTNQMKRTAVHRCAWLISFAVRLVDVCGCHGAVMGRMTALITVMKKAVKRRKLLHVHRISSCVEMAAVLVSVRFVMTSRTVKTGLMSIHTRTVAPSQVKKTVMLTMEAAHRNARCLEVWCSVLVTPATR